MIRPSIFNTPLLSPFVRSLGAFLLRLTGWQIKGSLPQSSKYLIIGAPHTSNWDFLLFLALVYQLRINPRFLGKAELFRPPFKGFFEYCGGIPVERTRANGLVGQIITLCENTSDFVLVIAPEGTRHGAVEWKHGFYHIAQGAGIPIVPARVDGAHRIVSLGHAFQPTGNLENDVRHLQDAFTGYHGIKPHRKLFPQTR